MKIRNKNREEFNNIKNMLVEYNKNTCSMPGIFQDKMMNVFVYQIIDSIRRVEYIKKISIRVKDLNYSRPFSGMFDPIKAAAVLQKRGDIDEAFWLVFLATHFGMHAMDGWRLVEDIYGKLGQGGVWNWNSVCVEPARMRAWLATNYPILTGDGISRRFSNHRKYESLRDTDAGTGAVIESYVNWLAPSHSHVELIRGSHRKVGQNPYEVFDLLYHDMDAVARFGRLGKFDFLTMLGKLGLAPIAPGKPYIEGATGPMRGAKLLFAVSEEDFSAKKLDSMVKKLGFHLGLDMQVMEDAMCNWQKSPDKYIYFRG
ncbi:hypothetical protein JCM17844_02700 [Iodidimonas gelatinilytica]|uniref:Alpha-glutamyl/putrescinyl thymine pyrophosphorylase clade 3 domain-containing protein n=1 Tax=Iodidimonas gelatinilytica TaxID=1236966 RepID=A0A5A7MNB4_9PROT|nr:hypothetical protein [Iodidimonas gelatinilytica]GEQ96633.1 hypothetical protein JCM17844_02700 [Iodidimonas gelatinilytica]GER00048.1 hypothetical protein JCM17845_06710 [Iodidimonas gelatinilytica]